MNWKKPWTLFGFFAVLLTLNSAQASTVVLADLPTLIAGSGVNSIWVDGEIVSAQESRNAVGWPVVTLEVKAHGKLLKEPSVGYQHPLFGQWVKPGAVDQTFKVQMFGGLGRELIPGIGGIPAVGTKGVMGFYGASKKSGLSGFVGTRAQGLFQEQVEDGQVKVVNGYGNQNLGLEKISNAKNSQTGKALQTLQAAPKGPLPKAQFLEVLQGLIDQNYASQSGRSS